MNPFAEACEQNKHPILEVLRQEFAETAAVLEIGSGTGQHGIFFAEQLPHLQWHCSDVNANLSGIQAWMLEFPRANLYGPIELDVIQSATWPSQTYDGVFSANTTHIMHWEMVVQMFAGIARILQPKGKFCLYGPFNYHGCYSSDSNARFDQWLKQRDPASGIRDITELQRLAVNAGMVLRNDYPMPVNNRILVWQMQ